jgi:hypothetical protein
LLFSALGNEDRHRTCLPPSDSDGCWPYRRREGVDDPTTVRSRPSHLLCFPRAPQRPDVATRILKDLGLHPASRIMEVGHGAAGGNDFVTSLSQRIIQGHFRNGKEVL